jgi:hypothetical protein
VGDRCRECGPENALIAGLTHFDCSPLQLLTELQRCSRQLSRKVKGSRNRAKARDRLARLHARIASQRKDVLHKLSTNLVRRFGVIVLEDLHVKQIIRGTFSDFGKLQAALEAQGVAVQSAESEYVVQNLVTLAEDKATEVLKLVDALEQDEDVQRVFHNLG